ncbi:prepilin-type N-terminal cleavage/methylation domain-containing protein [Gemmatimonadota bacterium]
MTRPFSHQAGFTFVELMITMAFLSIALLAVTSQFPMGLSISQSAEDLTLETNLAQELLEEIKSIPWDLIDSYDGLSENPPADLGGNPLDGTGGRANFSQYRRDVIVRYADPVTFDTTSVPSQLKRIEVSVTSTINGHSTTLMMIMAEKP